MSKHWYHVLISLKLRQYNYIVRRNVYYLGVQMMHLVALVENISHHFWWRCIDNSGRDNVSHVSMITVFRYLKRRIGEEPANSGKMNIAPNRESVSQVATNVVTVPKYCNSDRLLRSQLLEFLNKPVSLVLVVLGRPVIVKVVQNLNTSIELI